MVAQTETGNIIDFDGNSYKTIKIGNQWWMAENLRVKHFNDRTSIPYSSSSVTTSSDDYKVYRKYPNNDSLKIETYGMLYSWNVICNQNATTMKDLCPVGWEVPDTTDWAILATYLGGNSTAGGILKNTSTAWADPNSGAMDTYGFNALPAGDCNTSGYTVFGQEARFWTPQLAMATGAGRIYMSIKYNSATLSKGQYRNVNTQSIRCIKSESTTTAYKKVSSSIYTAKVFYSPLRDEILLSNCGSGSQITIISVNGTKVKQFTSISENAAEIDIQDLTRGIYLVSIKSEQGTQVVKFIKY